MAGGNGGAENLVKVDDFEGDLEEHWQDAKGRKVIDKTGDEVGTVEELYVWEAPSTVHLIAVSGDERSFLIPVHAVTNVDEEAIALEVGKGKLMDSPEFESEDVPDSETRRAAFEFYGYSDPLDLGGG
jgi:sporulation protein YlmC with PRC-barrel domain